MPRSRRTSSRGRSASRWTTSRALGLTRGRYLNGEAELKVSLEDGVLFVTIDSFEINGKRPPEEFMDSFRAQNIVKDIYKDPKTAEEIRKLESIEIKDGKIIIKARDRDEGEGGRPARGFAEERDQGRQGSSRPPAPGEEAGAAQRGGAGGREGPGRRPGTAESRPATPAEPAKKP